eukprot:gene5188-6458_t
MKILLYLGVIIVVLLSIVVNNIEAKRFKNGSPFFQQDLKFDPIPKHVSSKLDSESDAGEALILSKYLDNPRLGKKLSCVQTGFPFGDCSELEDIKDLRETATPFTFSGFFNVNSTYDSNLFYWFFEAQNGDKNAPILLWLQGGPGGTSLFGLFVENGPYSILDDLSMVPKNVTWNANYAMLYVDNPVGTGFSYTGSIDGFATNQDEIATNLYNLLQQFFQVYPEYRNNDFYITGESYAGKYIPALAYYIYNQNQQSYNEKIKLTGIAIGDGLCDPITQVTQYANLAFYLGLADVDQQSVMSSYQDKIVASIMNEEWMEANQLFTELINGPPDYFQNITGEPDYYDVRRTNEPSYGGDFVSFVNSSSVRQLLHVGNNYFQNTNQVYLSLQSDIPKSIKNLLPTLLDNIKVMLYNGQFDFIVGPSLTETFIRTIPWSGIQPFVQSNRIIWVVPSDPDNVAGYVRQYNNFVQVMVRSAGHILPYDQPNRAFDMITRFVDNKQFPTGN